MPFLEEFWECRSDQGRLISACPHRLRFGDTCFCKHPDRSKFARVSREKEL
jgi:hypothetical protein